MKGAYYAFWKRSLVSLPSGTRYGPERSTQNIEKEKKIQKKIDEKEAKLQSRETKIKYKEVFIIFGIICILQLISSLIEGLFI